MINNIVRESDYIEIYISFVAHKYIFSMDLCIQCFV